MKRMTALTFLTAALISMGNFHAQAQTVVFKVPFDFTVGKQVLPAGTYQVRYAAAHSILIQSLDWRSPATLIGTYAANPSTGVSRVIFAKYGNQYFLHEVLCSDESIHVNVNIPMSRPKKQARTREAQLPHIETIAALRTGAK